MLQKQRRLAVLGALALATGTLSAAGVFTATPALAVTCSGNGCNGQDPQASGCAADSKTLASARMRTPRGVDVGSIEMRYSNICATQWIRVNSTVTDCSGEPCQNEAIITRLAGPDGGSITFDDRGRPANGEPSQWSRMVYSAHEQSCGTGVIDRGSATDSEAFPNGVRGAQVCG